MKKQEEKSERSIKVTRFQAHAVFVRDNRVDIPRVLNIFCEILQIRYQYYNHFCFIADELELQVESLSEQIRRMEWKFMSYASEMDSKVEALQIKLDNLLKDADVV